jgi:diguanylate cyclase (GGDEF)-like protein
MLNISQKILTTIIAQLDSAISYHETWFDDVSQTLICRTTPNTADLAQDAHHNCRFGKWYYNDAHQRLRENPSFVAIEPLHKQMHERAAYLLQKQRENQQIQPSEYGGFSAALKQLRMQISALSAELSDISHRLDPLTGVYTRGGMLTNLRNDLERVKRRQCECTIIMLDIDNFKTVNDNYGHPAGDKVLTQVGSFICDQIRLYDSVYRYGGEEFLIVMQDCDKTVSAQITERLRQQLSELDIDCGAGVILNISASFGLYELEADVSVAESISSADQAMYIAKRNGKNRVVVWSEAIAH